MTTIDSTTIDMSTIDEEKLGAFMGQAVVDMAATISGPSLLIGERLGLFAVMVGAGPLSSADVADRAGVSERYTREWLRGQAAGGYLQYDEATDRFTLPDEHALALALPDSPYYVLGLYTSIASVFADVDKLVECFRTGAGFGWHEHDPRLFSGTERFFGPGYAANLVQQWLPSLDGAVEKLTAGITVADVGCGHGVSTILMAKAFPESTFRGFDYHDASVERARQLAETEGVSDRCTFEVARAQDFPGDGYSLVTHFDCLHDMGDPIGAARRVRDVLNDDGSWMIVEPMASDSVSDNFNPIGRLFYNASASICTPAALSQGGGQSLGAQAGEAKLREVIEKAGFTRIRRVMESPVNMILEARP